MNGITNKLWDVIDGDDGWRFWSIVAGTVDGADFMNSVTNGSRYVVIGVRYSFFMLLCTRITF
jgi:hypothetical protein